MHPTRRSLNNLFIIYQKNNLIAIYLYKKYNFFPVTSKFRQTKSDVYFKNNIFKLTKINIYDKVKTNFIRSKYFTYMESL